MKLFHLSMLLLLILSSFLVTAVEESPIVDPNQSAVLSESDVFKPLADIIRPVFSKINVIVGGLFGLYIILILVRIYYERKKLKVLQDIRFDMDQQNKHYHLPTSRSRRGPLQQLIASLFSKRLSSNQSYTKMVKKK